MKNLASYQRQGNTQIQATENIQIQIGQYDYDQQQQEEMAVNGCKAPEISFSAENKRYRVAREQS